MWLCTLITYSAVGNRYIEHKTMQKSVRKVYAFYPLDVTCACVWTNNMRKCRSKSVRQREIAIHPHVLPSPLRCDHDRILTELLVEFNYSTGVNGYRNYLNGKCRSLSTVLVHR